MQVLRTWVLGRARCTSRAGLVVSSQRVSKANAEAGYLQVYSRRHCLMLRSFVLSVCPAAGTAAEAVVHFLGGAFVGAAPQLSYRLFLEGLAARGVLVSRARGGRRFYD
jgi:hypothetical protein